ncbi:hypothetical protein BTZ20_1026 [Rhodococcus sp. MTM3W5.2]|uniref:hypothetical protein n=1 Tax=Rhodococcus sp. MTM3W5.2 TaxID=1805827 RepID=UPI0009794EB9|nr:hypothetical protein [Rhodococcus sp. MTM3W5.2]AQA23043.1 hypothetical protein BTZ20_1026 [Rhodococcus sp. MTM3W5.2]
MRGPTIGRIASMVVASAVLAGGLAAGSGVAGATLAESTPTAGSLGVTSVAGSNAAAGSSDIANDLLLAIELALNPNSCLRNPSGFCYGMG